MDAIINCLLLFRDALERHARGRFSLLGVAHLHRGWGDVFLYQGVLSFSSDNISTSCHLLALSPHQNHFGQGVNNFHTHVPRSFANIVNQPYSSETNISNIKVQEILLSMSPQHRPFQPRNRGASGDAIKLIYTAYHDYDDFERPLDREEICEMVSLRYGIDIEVAKWKSIFDRFDESDDEFTQRYKECIFRDRRRPKSISWVDIVDTTWKDNIDRHEAAQDRSAFLFGT